MFRPEHYWWKGQNQRTFQIGDFPRCIGDPQRRLANQDISKPLRNSFIHTGAVKANQEDIILVLELFATTFYTYAVKIYVQKGNI